MSRRIRVYRRRLIEVREAGIDGCQDVMINSEGIPEKDVS
jgi:hypothetical protein